MHRNVAGGRTFLQAGFRPNARLLEMRDLFLQSARYGRVNARITNDSSRAYVARRARLTLLRPGRTLRVNGVYCLCERGFCLTLSVSVCFFRRAFRVSKVARRVCDFLPGMRYKVRKRAGICCRRFWRWFRCWCWCWLSLVRETPFY